MSNIYHDLNKIMHCRLDSYASNPNQSVRDRLWSDLEPAIQQTLAEKKRPVVLASLYWERYDLDEVESEIVKPLIEWLRIRAAGFHLLVNSAYDYTTYHRWHSLPQTKITALDFSILRTDWLHDYFNQATSDRWQSSASKALLLTGKAHKKNRIGLLAKFYDLDAMDRLQHSLHVNPGIIARCRSLVGDWSDEKYDRFIQAHAKNPDSIEMEWQQDSSHYWGVPYDPNLYANTALSIISESSIDDPYSFITEKTYRPILNHHPFVLAGSWHSLEWLRAAGFKTFEEYMPIAEYDRLSPPDRMDAVVANTLAFLKRDHSADSKITLDILHNRQQLSVRLQQQRHKLREIMLKYTSLVTDVDVKTLISRF